VGERKDVPVLDYDSLAAYQSGALTPEDEARVQEHLLRSPDSVQRLLWLAGDELPQGEDTSSEMERQRAWRRLREQLRPEESAGRPRQLLLAAASTLLAVGMGFAWLFSSQASRERIAGLEERLQAREPPALAALGTPLLYPERATRSGGGEARIQVPRDAEVFVVILETASLSETAQEWAVEILDIHREVVWQATGRPDDLGHLVVTLSRRLLPENRYRIRIRPLDGSSPEKEVDLEL